LLYKNDKGQICESQSKARLQLWDSPGKEVFCSHLSMYLRDSKGIVMVYDITDPESFIAIETKWLLMIRQYNYTAKILMLGTKIDCERKVNFEVNIP
jgi:GTPase SAR1 family protein